MKDKADLSIRINNKKPDLLFRELQNELQSEVIFFNGIINEYSRKCLGKIIVSSSTYDIITVIISSIGGYFFDPVSQTTLTDFFRKKYRTINCIIADHAKSAASVFALSSDNLFLLNKNCCIGLIDPRNKDNFEELPINISYEDLTFNNNGTLKLNQEKFQDNPELFSNTQFTIQNSYEALHSGKILDKTKLEEQFCTLLGFNISKGLNHSNDINYFQMKDIGLKVNVIGDQMADKIRPIHERLEKRLQGGKYNYFIIESIDEEGFNFRQ
jgi:hypothetical protein